MARKSKLTREILISRTRILVKAYIEMIADGAGDTFAIEGLNRIVNRLGWDVNYPGLTNDSVSYYRKYAAAEFSAAAWAAHQRGAGKDELRTEHVEPQSEFTRKVADLVTNGASDDDLIKFMRKFRMVVLTMDEVKRLDKINRSRMTPDRLAEAGIVCFVPDVAMAA
jgi:hypothetical protein